MTELLECRGTSISVTPESNPSVCKQYSGLLHVVLLVLVVLVEEVAVAVRSMSSIGPRC